MTRLLFIKQEILPKGGLEKYTKKLVQAFLAHGCETTLLSASGGVPVFEGAKVEHLPLKGLFGFERLKAWDRITKNYSDRYPADCIFSLDRITCPTHIRAGNGVHAAYLQRRSTSFLKRCSFRINPLHRTLLQLEKTALSSPHLQRIIVNSKMVGQEMQEFYGIDHSKIAVCHNGVEWQEMASDFAQWKDTRECLQQELALPRDSFLFLFAGHHYQRKGLDYVLHALANTNGAHLLVVGNETKLSRYQELVRRLGLEKRVHFLGPRQDMRRLYAVADALVVPSLYDPFANVTVEALAMGLFIVSSGFNGGKEILNPSSGVVIEDLFDPSSVQAALEHAMLYPKTLHSAEAIRRQYVSFDFSIQLPYLIQKCLK